MKWFSHLDHVLSLLRVQFGCNNNCFDLLWLFLKLLFGELGAMEEESSSWVRRTNFSHTVCHRLDSSRLPIFHRSVKSDQGLDFQLPVDRAVRPKAKSSCTRSSSMSSVLLPSKPNTNKGLTSRSLTSDSLSCSFAGGQDPMLKPKFSKPKYLDSGSFSGISVGSKLDQDSRKSRLFIDRQERNSKPKQRSASPLPTTTTSDTFRDAKVSERRFLTPPPRRQGSEKNAFGRLFSKKPQELQPSPSRSQENPLQHLSSMKIFDKVKSRKENSWTRYFDHGAARVTAVEASEDCMVDLSKLYIGLRFACGAHSRLYHGMYKDQPVAVKIIRQPDDDENGVMAARLEKQFNREVTLLSHLYHRNVIKVLLFLILLFLNVLILFIYSG